MKLKTATIKNITTKDAAKLIGYTTKDLDTYCKNKYSKTFSQVKIDLQMKLARKLLTESFYSVANTAKKTGFATPFSFSKAFKKYHGISPKDFKNNT